jgi:hypothetical protein
MTDKKRRGKAASSPEGTKLEIPLDIVLSLLTPKERAKLRNYVLYGDTFYQANDAMKEEAYALLAERHAISINHMKTRLQDPEETLHAELHKLLVGLQAKYDTHNKTATQETGTIVKIRKPFLIRFLESSMQVTAQQHGCEIQERDLSRHMVTFPASTRMDIASSTSIPILFPDGYRCVLIWKEDIYHWEEISVQ